MSLFRRHRDGTAAAEAALIAAERSREAAHAELERQRRLHMEAQQIAAELGAHNASNHYDQMLRNALIGRHA